MNAAQHPVAILRRFQPPGQLGDHRHPPLPLTLADDDLLPKLRTNKGLEVVKVRFVVRPQHIPTAITLQPQRLAQIGIPHSPGRRRPGARLTGLVPHLPAPPTDQPPGLPQLPGRPWHDNHPGAFAAPRTPHQHLTGGKMPRGQPLVAEPLLIDCHVRPSVVNCCIDGPPTVPCSVSARCFRRKAHRRRRCSCRVLGSVDSDQISAVNEKIHALGGRIRSQATELRR